MRAYIAGSLTDLQGNYEKMMAFYRQIEDVCKKNNITPYLPHGNLNDASPEKIYQECYKNLEEVNILIAYIGKPSTGTGMEIVWANKMEKTIILIGEKEVFKRKYMQLGIPGTWLIPYETREEGLSLLDKVLGKLAEKELVIYWEDNPLKDFIKTQLEEINYKFAGEMKEAICSLRKECKKKFKLMEDIFCTEGEDVDKVWKKHSEKGMRLIKGIQEITWNSLWKIREEIRRVK
ncbi:MAG: hypothetical protein WC309_04395 [Candidatus Paceibacterota bacterium]